MKDISLFDIKKIILAMKVLVIIINRAKLLRKQSSKKRMFYSWDKEKGLGTALPTKLKRRPAFLIDINGNNVKSSLAKHSSLNSLLTAKRMSIIGIFLVRIFPHCIRNAYQDLQTKCSYSVRKIMTRKTTNMDTFDSL